MDSDKSIPLSESTSNTVKYDNGCGRTILLGCIAVICAVCCVATSLVAFTGGVTYLALKDAPGVGMITNKICNIELDKLREAYDQRFTVSYKQRVSYNEFRRLYTQDIAAFAACTTDNEALDAGEFLNKQISFSYQQDEITLEFTSKDKRISMQLYKVDNDWLIDQLHVQ